MDSNALPGHVEDVAQRPNASIICADLSQPSSVHPVSPASMEDQPSSGAGNVIDPNFGVLSNEPSASSQPRDPHTLYNVHNEPRPTISGTPTDLSLRDLSSYLDSVLRWVGISYDSEDQFPDVLRNDAELSAVIYEALRKAEREALRVLTEMDRLGPTQFHDPELENVGPDHDVNELGSLIDSKEMTGLQNQLYQLESGNKHFQKDVEDDRDRDPCVRCSICLDDYTEEDPPFRITACSHILGRSCFETFINSTARSSNMCPICRTCLVPRRPRRAISRSEENDTQMTVLCSQLLVALFTIEDAFASMPLVWSFPDFRDFAREEPSLNAELREHRIGFQMMFAPISRRNVHNFRMYRVHWNADGSLGEASEGYDELSAMWTSSNASTTA